MGDRATSRAMANQVYTRQLLAIKDPEYAAILEYAVACVAFCTAIPVIGFGDLDFEHGANCPRYGSDEVE